MFTTIEHITSNSIKITTRIGTHLEEHWINTPATYRPARIVSIEGSAERKNVHLTIEAEVDPTHTHAGDIILLAFPEETK